MKRPKRIGRTGFVVAAAAVALIAGIAAAWGCGYLADKGEESRGTSNLPSQGIGPWTKYGILCAGEQDVPTGKSPDTAPHPVILPSPIGHVYGEPSVVSDPEELTVFYEDRTSQQSRIRRARLTLGPSQCSLRPAEIVVEEDAAAFFAEESGFEAGRAGQPAVLKGAPLPGVEGADATYAMYYVGGDGLGIGLAVSPDGKSWTRIGAAGRPLPAGAAGEPLIAPIEGGWEEGGIGSPSVIRTPSGELRLYFDGNRTGSRSIGLATSDDGVRWTRLDGQGRTGADAGPILAPSFTGPKKQTNWEFQRSTDPDSGSVGAPMVLLDRGPLRDIYILYYTGNLRGPLLDTYDDTDTSIGAAFSLDGISFEKASTEVIFPHTANEVNPILSEHFPLCLSNDDLTCFLTAFEPRFDFFWGKDGFCRREENKFHSICIRTDPGTGEPGSGSSNSTSPLFIVDEAEPSVARFGEQYALFYHQQSDVLHFLENGIAVALNNFGG